MNPRTDDVLLGRYLLGERLAVGGMGEIRLALHLGLGRFKKPLALKLLLPHLAALPQAVQMFLDEAHLASSMNHPNIVQIYDVGVDGERYFIAMELVHGVAMSTLIAALRKAGRRLPGKVLEYVGRSLCDGLHHAHEKVGEDGRSLGLVHRDVTPHNILLSVDGEVKLTDFGIARARDHDAHTRPGVLKGKLEYLAPEQVAGKPFDRRADLYGAGITLFQLATLVPPFRRNTDEEMLRAIRLDALPDLSLLRPDLSPDFIQAVRRATEKDPENRFSTARAFRDALGPASSTASAEELGEGVRELCSEAVERLEQKTALTIHLATATTQNTASDAKPGARKASRTGIAVLLGALVALGAYEYLQFEREAPRPPVRAPPVVPSAQAGPPPVPTDASPTPPPSSPAPIAPQSEPPTPVRAASRGAKAAPKKPKTPEPAGVGYLSVDAVPWATVFIDGQRAGDTPIASYPVHSGTVVVTLENEELGRTVKREVRVVSGKKSQMKVDLR